MPDLISIIIPFYNDELYVKNCTDMLKAQDYPELEFIIVNDGSSDGTLRLLEQYTAGDGRFHIVSRPNGGVCRARNTGVEHARGTYLSFVDSDDYIYPDYISHLYELLTSAQADVACGNTFKTYPLAEIPSFKYDGTVMHFRGTEAVVNMLYRKNIPPYACCKLFRADLVRQTPFIEDITYGEDTLFTFHLLQKAKKTVFSSKTLYLYYQQEDSVNHRFDSSQLAPSWNAFIEYFENSEAASDPEIRKAISAKGFVYASDFCTRIEKHGQDQQIYETLREYIRQKSSGVRKDKDCKRINRFMAFLAGLNTDFYLSICRGVVVLKRKMRMELRHAL